MPVVGYLTLSAVNSNVSVLEHTLSVLVEVLLVLILIKQ